MPKPDTDVNLLNIIVLGSVCPMSDAFYEEVVKVANELKLIFTIEKQETEKLISKFGVSHRCLYGYCPGCNAMNEEEQGNDKYTPALVINDILIQHGSFPTYKTLRAILERYVGNG